EPVTTPFRTERCRPDRVLAQRRAPDPVCRAAPAEVPGDVRAPDACGLVRFARRLATATRPRRRRGASHDPRRWNRAAAVKSSRIDHRGNPRAVGRTGGTQSRTQFLACAVDPLHDGQSRPRPLWEGMRARFAAPRGRSADAAADRGAAVCMEPAAPAGPWAVLGTHAASGTTATAPPPAPPRSPGPPCTPADCW